MIRAASNRKIQMMIFREFMSLRLGVGYRVMGRCRVPGSVRELLPVVIGILMQVILVLIPGLQRIVEKTVVKKEELAIHDLESAGVHFDLGTVLSHGIGAPAAVLGLIA